ncbi:MAG: DUF2779 domain-containing protein [Candidatus Promineofilum sp.]|nr:DUF2779 domain-containing protein [Promineifilum sp.]
MHDYYLTKSDFKVAQSCPTKLFYHKRHYPTREEGDEYLGHLADQGYLIEALARLFYPDGRWLGFQKDVEAAAWDTMAALSGNGTLFEATLISGGKLARVDILVRRGDVFELIEIKSCSFDRQKNDELVQNGRPNLFRSPRSPDGIRSEWRPYLEDAAFQTSILQDIFPGATIIPYLLMPDTSRACHIDGLHRRFALRPAQDHQDQLPYSDYTGDPREIRRNPMLVRVDVSAEIQLLLPEVRRRADTYVKSLIPELTRIATPPSTHCRACEYRIPDNQESGFHECWGQMATIKPHIFDLYHVSQIRSGDGPAADQLIAQGKAGLFDMPEKYLARSDGTLGENARRQRTQIQCTRDQREWISDELRDALESLTYPLHFVDFETCAPAIPRYQRMHPYETIAFQWSCHTIVTPDAQPRHAEWLQAADIFPNPAFAKSLRRQVGDEGSILIWSTHEKTVLRSVQKQLAEREDGEGDTVEWIGRLLAGERMTDLNDLTRKHYFHPRMGGRTSLKVVADAVWQADPHIRARLPHYHREMGTGSTSPYQALPPLVIGDRQIAVAEGVGAILAYYALIERMTANATLEVSRWRRLLSQYCELDTMAMVMVWWRWRRLTGQMA